MHAYLVDVFDSKLAISELDKIGVSKSGKYIMSNKLIFIVIKLKNINSTALNILKQEALSIGAELANHRDVITGKINISDGILFGTLVQLRIIVKKIRHQQFGLKELSSDIENILDVVNINVEHIDSNNSDLKFKILKTNKKDITLGKVPLIMGILNVTPDSFSDGGLYFNFEDAVNRGFEIVKEGADIIDIGGESTRPAADFIDIQTEIDRVCPVIKKLSENIDVPISIDTRKPEVAKEAILAGAAIVNDVSGLTYEPDDMINVLTSYDVPYILMHSRNKNPQNMQIDVEPYNDAAFDIILYFSEKLAYLKSKGFDTDKVVLDPGFGFAKSAEDNYDILNYILSFKSLNLPILAGVSRKSFIKKITGGQKEDLLIGNIALASYLTLKNIDIIRVHDVRQTKTALNTIAKLKENLVRHQ
ncbi:MAG: dihydropteroate synthase [Candidatus Acididesulfobacter guangdongensis]|uniref:dihydropteroate synthase n=1 Tax=Acididesulfobacter guangdongensis TaxID=2597225 RepID=A0A519BFS0_ACIG2|nr:MAG: dihydropteroate synthase [Candidatus Acididesulfobacter guangdongensis]